jgi:N-acetylglucosamine-6-sulfatase
VKLLALGLLAAALLAAVLAAPAQARPNVVVVMTDDQDFRSMSAMPKTERLIGHRGTTFARSIVSFPLCCPSRATFFTGTYAHNHGVKWNNFPEGGFYRFHQRETLPVWLQRAGYRTIHIGKYLNETGERNPRQVPRGWTDYHGGVDPYTYAYYGFELNHNGHVQTYPNDAAHYSTDVYAGLAERAIDTAHKDGRPFFLNVAPNAPHTVAVASNARIEGTPAQPPPRYAGVYANAQLPRYPDFNEADISDKPPSIQALYPNPLNDDQIAALTDHYRGRMGALMGVDDLVAGVVRELERTGEYRNTVIVFTSDNGWILGEHRLYDPQTIDGRPSGVKFVPYEGSSRVPLMIAGPGFPAGRTVKGITVNADLAPTIEQLTGAKPKLPQDGISLVGPARHPAELDGRGVLLETFQNPRDVPWYHSIRTERYRLDVENDGLVGLADFKVDPWELDNHAADPAYAGVVAKLRAALDQLNTCKGRSCRVDVGVPSPRAHPPGS